MNVGIFGHIFTSYMYLFSLLYVLKKFSNKVDYTRNIRHLTG